MIILRWTLSHIKVNILEFIYDIVFYLIIKLIDLKLPTLES